MKICSFGTIRTDIKLYQKNFDLLKYNESKASGMMIEVGGSVYVTSLLLAHSLCDVDYYTLRHSGKLSEYINLEVEKGPLSIIKSEKDSNITAISVILLDGNGEKKIISYDGKRDDSGVLDLLAQSSGEYDLFYTSFYEINDENISSLSTVMKEVNSSFVDLSPLIYRVSKKNIEIVLSSVSILSGTHDEFEILFKIIDVTSIRELMEIFPIKEVYEKKGREGAIVYFRKNPSENNISVNDGVDFYEVPVLGTGYSNDTTGCGDAFSAAIIYGKKNSFSIIELLKFAVNTASLVAYNGFIPSEIVNAWEKGFVFDS